MSGYVNVDAIKHLIDIKTIPTADVAPVVHGEWKDGRCTNCNVALREVFFEEPISYVDLKYCPFCGARMDGEK